MSRKQVKKNHFWLLGLLLLITLLLLLSIGKRGFIQQFRVSHEKKQLEQDIESLVSDKAVLEEELEKLDDPEYVEKIAREQYGMARKDEKVYRVVPKDE